MKIHLILAHGWGYTPQIFDPLLTTWNTSQIAAPITIQALDQGYYSHQPAFYTWHGDTQTWQASQAPHPTQPHTHLIGLGHSLGFSKLLQLALPWKKLISINGFTHFPQTPALRRMINKAQQQLQPVLEAFLQQCGTPLLTPATPCHPEALLHDLANLQHLNTQPQLNTHHQRGTHIIHIATQQDTIIPASQSTACFSHLPASTIQLHPQDGTHSDLYTTPTRYTWLFEHIQRSTPF